MPKFLDSALFAVALTGLLYFAGYVYTDAYYASLGLHMSLVSMTADEVMMMGSIPILVSVIIVLLTFPTAYLIGGIGLKKFLGSHKSELDVTVGKWMVHSFASIVFVLIAVKFLLYCDHKGKERAAAYVKECSGSTYKIIPSNPLSESVTGCFIRYSYDMYWLRLMEDGNLVGIAKGDVGSIEVFNSSESAEKAKI